MTRTVNAIRLSLAQLLSSTNLFSCQITLVQEWFMVTKYNKNQPGFIANRIGLAYSVYILQGRVHKIRIAAAFALTNVVKVAPR